MNWIIANLGTIAVGLIVAAVVALIILNHFKKKKQGKPGCGCGCANCPMKDKCK